MLTTPARSLSTPPTAPRTSSAPAIPASAPASDIASHTRRPEGMPLACAASDPAPTARHSNPRRVRVSRNQTPTAMASTSGKPRSRRLPGMGRGSQAARLIGSVPAMLIDEFPVEAASGPATSQPCTRWMATQLRRMVLITSCTPRRTFRRAGISPQHAPASAAAASASGSATGESRRPTTAAARPPQISCPSAPMLKSPTVKAMATLRPVRMRTADLIAVSPSGPGPASAPAARLPNPASGSRPVAAMATKLIKSDAATAATALQSGSRAGAKSFSRMRGGLPGAQHQAAQILVARARRGFAGGAAVVENEDAIADGSQLVEIERDEQDGGAVFAGFAQRVVHSARGAQVESAGRLHRDHQARRRASRQLARGDQLLLVSAGEIAGASERLGRADVEIADQFQRFLAAARLVDECASRVGRVALPAEGEVFFDAERQAEGAAVPIFRQVDDAGGTRGAGRALKAVAAVEAQRARGFSQAGEDFGELALAVAVDAGDAEDLA